MSGQLNIKDEATIALARSRALRTGTSITATIREALERADADDHLSVMARAEDLLSRLRDITIDPPPTHGRRNAREIVDAFHETEWEEQYGRDRWS